MCTDDVDAARPSALSCRWPPRDERTTSANEGGLRTCGGLPRLGLGQLLEPGRREAGSRRVDRVERRRASGEEGEQIRNGRHPVILPADLRLVCAGISDVVPGFPRRFLGTQPEIPAQRATGRLPVGACRPPGAPMVWAGAKDWPTAPRWWRGWPSPLCRVRCGEERRPTRCGAAVGRAPGARRQRRAAFPQGCDPADSTARRTL
jgi:hypothetical protein